MPKLKIAPLLVVVILLITGCNLKLNLNTNLSENSIQMEPNNENQNKNTNQTVEEANVNSGQLVANNRVNFSFELTDDKMIKKIINKTSGEIWISDIKSLCGQEMMIFAQPADSIKIILKPYNPGSDLPVRDLYLLNLQVKTCHKMAISKELSDFGARILSPDQTKLAVALETDEAKVLKVLDLIADQSKIVVTLNEGETLNGGYGALSNKFDIQWQGNDRIQYTVFENKIKNYPDKMPDAPEKIKEVRIINL